MDIMLSTLIPMVTIILQMDMNPSILTPLEPTIPQMVILLFILTPVVLVIPQIDTERSTTILLVAQMSHSVVERDTISLQVTTISLSDPIPTLHLLLDQINSTSVTGYMVVVDISVSEILLLPTSSMYPELVHSQDSVSRQEHPMDTFSPQMHLEMPLGKQHLVDDGDSLVMPEPIQQLSSSEPPMPRISYSKQIASRDSVSTQALQPIISLLVSHEVISS
jgi:hypothetical protein